MSDSEPQARGSKWFVSLPQYHRPRLRRGLHLLVIGMALLGLGIYLVSNGLPETSSRRPQLMAQAIPTLAGAFTLIFGVIGVVTAAVRIRRKGPPATDLELEQQGIKVRGDQLIPWGSVDSVISVKYVNSAKIQLLWNHDDLHRALLVILNEDIDIPGQKIVDGKPRITIDLLYYPATDYSKRYEAAIEQFNKRNISVTHQTKWKQT